MLKLEATIELDTLFGEYDYNFLHILARTLMQYPEVHSVSLRYVGERREETRKWERKPKEEDNG